MMRISEHGPTNDRHNESDNWTTDATDGCIYKLVCVCVSVLTHSKALKLLVALKTFETVVFPGSARLALFSGSERDKDQKKRDRSEDIIPRLLILSLPDRSRARYLRVP